MTKPMGRFILPVTGEWILESVRRLHPCGEDIPEDARVVAVEAEAARSTAIVVCDTESARCDWGEGGHPTVLMGAVGTYHLPKPIRLTEEQDLKWREFMRENEWARAKLREMEALDEAD